MGWAVSRPSSHRLPDSRNIALWFRCIRGALLQAIRIRATAFTSINIAVRIKVNVSRWPFWGDVDAMVASLVTPPIELHKEVFIWE
jgi:hypothetical protein